MVEMWQLIEMHDVILIGLLDGDRNRALLCKTFLKARPAPLLFFRGLYSSLHT